ncbi:MAG: MBL fold metallo-hydrolase [Ignavibacteria bacterium]|nr:MBL fold metallo-hydrolase [Ignavibacteria bacterium]
MKKLHPKFTSSLLLTIVMTIVFSGCVSLKDFDRATMTMRIDTLKTVKLGWKGTPVDESGRFQNHEFPADQDFNSFFLWQAWGNPEAEAKKKDTFRMKTVDATQFLKSKEEGVVLVGHASFLIRIGGKTILTDPVLTAPTAFHIRYSPLPFKTEDLRGIDYIFLSHDHRDHMDEESLKLIYKQNPDVTILTGLRTTPLLLEWLPGVKVMEAGWYQEYSLGLKDLSVIFLPSRHWSQRGPFDRNLRLWGAYLIKSGETKIYFGGDSGYGSHFKEVGELFGEVDIAMIGIGAYKPRWFMHPNHTSPLQALRGAREMKTRNLIPMHYGTFAMGDEPIGDPQRTIIKEYNKRKYKFRLLLPNPGEIIKFGKN